MDPRSALSRYVIGPLSEPFLSTGRLHWIYIAAALAIALAAAADEARLEGAPAGPRRLLGRLFPRRVWWHPSARVDYAFFVVDAVLFAALLAPWLETHAVGRGLGRDLAAWLLGPRDGAGPWSWPAALALTTAFVVAVDLGLWLVHWLQHRVPLLWAFHSVHHSAEVMTPITVFRMHPLDSALNVAVTAFLGGLVLGTASWAWPGLQPLGILGLDAFTFLFYVAGYSLRHSHVWVDWGPALSRVFVSPAMHQVHHSADPKHWDRNLGFMLSVWDVLAGTAWIPEEREALTYGLGAGRAADHDGVVALYLTPFADAIRGRATALRATRPAQVALALSVVTVVGVAWLHAHRPGAGPVARPEAPAAPAPPSDPVRLAELTWPEVAERVRGGATTVIIPTGGLEQNGPHMVLGKHDAIVGYTSVAIARELGDALVAPVIGYVPEGEVDPPTLHMRWPGTISVPDDVFAGVLEAAARSMRQAGFKTICFLGDSLGNQPAQERVARALDEAWRADGVRVLHLNEYYAANGQVAWLREQGEVDAAIGGHAGIRDTSELLAVWPDGIRTSRLQPGGGGRFEESGVDGDPTRASADRGQALLRLKVDAAVRQIRALRAAPPPPPATVAPVDSA